MGVEQTIHIPTGMLIQGTISVAGFLISGLVALALWGFRKVLTDQKEAIQQIGNKADQAQIFIAASTNTIAEARQAVHELIRFEVKLEEMSRASTLVFETKRDLDQAWLQIRTLTTKLDTVLAKDARQ